MKIKQFFLYFDDNHELERRKMVKFQPKMMKNEENGPQGNKNVSFSYDFHLYMSQNG